MQSDGQMGRNWNRFSAVFLFLIVCPEGRCLSGTKMCFRSKKSLFHRIGEEAYILSRNAGVLNIQMLNLLGHKTENPIPPGAAPSQGENSQLG
jgi:hypothetical protein